VGVALEVCVGFGAFSVGVEDILSGFM